MFESPVGDAEAIKQLAAELPYMDLERVWVFSTSWGGHFTFRALAHAPKLYKIGVSVVWSSAPHAFILYEPYLGMPQDNKAGVQVRLAVWPGRQYPGQLPYGNTSDHATFRDLIEMVEALVLVGKHHDFTWRSP